jgi:hypothetical protein
MSDAERNKQFDFTVLEIPLRLALSAIRVFTNIAEKWSLSESQVRSVLGGIASSALHAWKSDPEANVDLLMEEFKEWIANGCCELMDVVAALKEEMTPMIVQIPDSSDAILGQIAKEKSITKVEALRRLLAVLDVVQEHKQKGNQLAVVDSDGSLVSRLIGI